MSDPALQNIPIETELSKRIKEALKGPQPKELIIQDYSAIELRVLAYLTDEEIEAFLKGPP